MEVSAKRYRYTSKERDEESGLYYHGARYYAPWLGRWTSADPAGMVDGPNLYAYVENNPIIRHDPSGRDWESDLNRRQGKHDRADTAEADPDTPRPGTPSQQELDASTPGWAKFGMNLCLGSYEMARYTAGVADKIEAKQEQGKAAGEDPLVTATKATGYAVVHTLGSEVVIQGPEVALPGVLGKIKNSKAGQFVSNLFRSNNAVKGAGEVVENVVEEVIEEAPSAKTVIGKLNDLQDLSPGENTLLKHMQGELESPQAYWKRNSSVLRREMNKGLPIRDASVDAAGKLIEAPGSFLDMERNLLKNHGWIYDETTTMWSPP